MVSAQSASTWRNGMSGIAFAVEGDAPQLTHRKSTGWAGTARDRRFRPVQNIRAARLKQEPGDVEWGYFPRSPLGPAVSGFIWAGGYVVSGAWGKASRTGQAFR